MKMDNSNSTLERVHSLLGKVAARESGKALPRPARLLVVDDDTNETLILERELLKVGVEVTCANHGKKAIEIVAGEKMRNQRRPLFDLILLDLKMPQMSGPETMTQLKLLVPDIPIVIYTGFPKSEEMAAAMKLGFFGVVEKPINLNKLVEIFTAYHLRPSD